MVGALAKKHDDVAKLFGLKLTGQVRIPKRKTALDIEAVSDVTISKVAVGQVEKF